MKNESQPKLHRIDGKAAAVDFRGLAERSHDGIYHYDFSNKRFQFANQPFLNFFGVDPNNVGEFSLDDALLQIHREDRDNLRRIMTESLKSGHEGGEAEYRLARPDGSSRWVHDRWIVIRDNDGRAMAIEGFIRDTTDRKRADAELEASKTKALIGSYIVQDRRFRYVNPEFVRITGYSADELARMNPMDVVHDDYKEFVRESAIQMLKGRRSDPYEFCTIDKKGEIHWIMETVTSIQYNGRPAALGYFMDITKLRTAQHNLASLGLMVGAVSHSLKACLTGLDAALYLVDTGFYRDQPARIEEGLDTAKMMVDRIGKLVYDVLYYVKERELEPEDIDVLQFTNELATSIATRMKGADINFTCRFVPPLGWFEIDRELIRPALLNILENAMEACIEDESKPDHQIELSVRGELGWVYIDITDNGPGMDKDQLKNAFSLFYSSKGRKGTGLGLFITKKVINQHGGQVTLESKPNSGAKVHIRLPRKCKHDHSPAVPVGAGVGI
jgi:PAS domain S-box-containing protein